MNATASTRRERVHRIEWVPGTDRQRASCHCGAERVFEDPVELWDWLSAHPVGHGGAEAAGADPAPDRQLRPTGEREFDVFVTGTELVAAGVARLTLQPADGGLVPAWSPGAHVDLLLGTNLVRQYSLCGDPAEASTMHVAVLREPDGRGGSRHVHDVLKPGARLRIRGPRNNFPLERSANYLFIAGGIGITPILPMIAEVAARPDARWRLVYGGRTRASMAFLEQLRALSAADVQIEPEDEVGLLDLTAILDAAAPDSAVYCCGPEPLLAAVEAACEKRRGLRLHVERFAAKPDIDQRPREAFDVELARAGLRLTVADNTSILQALENAGVEVLSSCREGVCGTCETSVLAGVPDHRDSVLTRAEQQAGDTMMICVSRSRSPLLVLDR